MICYRDRTYCSRALEDCSCDESRKITPEVAKAADEWWNGDKPEYMREPAPFCVSELCSGKVVPMRKK